MWMEMVVPFFAMTAAGVWDGGKSWFDAATRGGDLVVSAEIYAM